MIFTGGRSAKVSGAYKRLKEVLPRGSNIIQFSGIQPDPAVESLGKGIKKCKKAKPDLIVAVGGGSVIDYAKAVSVLALEKGDYYDLFRGRRKLNGRKIPFIAVPTTFGTSSEITPFAVMVDKGGCNKVTLEDRCMFPDMAFTDPAFTLTMPLHVVAASCADLFSHAVEAYWNRNATDITDQFASRSIKLFFEHYKKTFKFPRNTAVREKISLASIYAGLAFSNTRTTACHAVSYPLTSIFGVPHGAACILTLGETLAFNAARDAKKISKLCDVMGCSGVPGARKKIASIMKALGIKGRLRSYGISRTDIKTIVDNGFTPVRMKNNPRKVTRKDLTDILERIY
jgi:alcohol dehydrogenase